MGYTPPQLYLTKVGTDTKIYGIGTVTGDTLYIYSNLVDTYPNLFMGGTGHVILDITTGDYFQIKEQGTGRIKFYRSGTDVIIEGSTANDNILLSPTGTGKVKFGTFTGSGDVAVNGSISILDSGGTARKLATVA